MTVGASTRRAAFWALDAARGSRIRRNLDDIHSIMEGTGVPSERLEPLLEHAIRTTPFYSDVRRPHLDAFPVVTRTLLQRQPETLHSAAHADASVREATTSGSSGRPVTIRQDRRKRLRSIADTIYVNETCGQLVGDPLLWIKAWGPGDSQAGLVRRAQNVATFEVRGLNDERMLRIVSVLRERPINAMLAYTSALQAMVRFVESRGIDMRAAGLRVIINDSETLHGRLRGQLEATFGCPVADRYANEENGMLAFVAPGSDAFRLNRASYFFEFLHLDADSPQRAGEPARVVVTDLYNYAMPLIRYDTGDIAVTPRQDGSSPMTIERLEGRRLDSVLDSSGQIVSSTMLATAMDPFDQLQQYQVRQLGAHAFQLLVAGAEGVYTTAELRNALVGLFGSGTHVAVDHVAEIPAEPSGKFRVLIPLARGGGTDSQASSLADSTSDEKAGG